MRNVLARLWSDEGQDLTEYALLMSLVTMIGVLSVKVLGQAMSNLFSNSATKTAAS